MQTSASLKGIADGGWIREDVMAEIWDISNIPLPFTDMIGSDTVSNSYTEWPIDKLGAVDTANAHVDGADTATDNDTVANASRVGNHCQLSLKSVKVSSRAQASDGVPTADALAYQISQRQIELRRDVEAIMLGQQASIADNGSSTAGKSAGFGAWLTTNAFRGALGASGGYGATSPSIVDAPTPGTVRALTETLVRDCAQSVYEQGGNPSTLMSVPGVIRKLSEFMFGGSARIATLTSDVQEKTAAAVATGSVNVFVTDFGVTLKMVANRIQQLVTTNNANVYLIDPGMVRQGFLRGYQVNPLAKTGTADRRQIEVDWTLKVLNEAAQGVIADVNPTAAVTA